MKNNLRNTTMLAFLAGAIAGPVIYYLIRNKQQAQDTGEQDYGAEGHGRKLFAAYRGTHKPHHRKPNHNGHLN